MTRTRLAALVALLTLTVGACGSGGGTENDKATNSGGTNTTLNPSQTQSGSGGATGNGGAAGGGSNGGSSSNSGGANSTGTGAGTGSGTTP